MAYIVFGAQSLMVKKQIKKIVSETFNDPNNLDTVYLDSRKIEEKDLLDECEQISLCGDKKVVVVENCSFLTAERVKNKFLYTDKLLDYLSNENPSTVLIFSVIYDKKLDSRGKIYKILSKKGKIVECKDLDANDWLAYISSFFERRNVKIEKKAVNELCKRCDGNLNIFINEANKLLLYKTNSISFEDVVETVTKPLYSNVFDILHNLMHGNKEKAIVIYRDLLIAKIEPVVLISIITESLIYLDKVLYLNDKHYSYGIIASKTSSNPYRVSITISNFRNIDKKLIKKSIESLYFLDRTIKHNEINRFFGFEMFLVNF